MAGKPPGIKQLRKCQICVAIGVALAVGLQTVQASVVVDFEDMPLPSESFYNGSDGAGGFVSRGAVFNNTFTDFGGGFVAWTGWSYSNVTDNTTPGIENQYAAVTGGGADGSSHYALAFAAAPGDATIKLPASMSPQSVLVTNTAYSYFSMLNGDQFARKFGGESGDDPDYFLLTITGLDGNNQPVGALEFYLADYRFENNSLDYLVDTWTEVDLSSLDGAATLSFGLASSDVGQFGMNTPAYFAIDNLALIPEPATLGLMTVGTMAVLSRSRIRRARRRNHGMAR